jgi:6-pyruvoyl-tetrahydropterin synthase
MSQVVRTTISCPRCRTSFPAIIEQIIDVGRDPQAKVRFLSGRVNMITCPSCGHVFAVGTPLLYHDPAKELLLMYVPMELNISTADRERVMGDLQRRLIDSIPPEQRKGYLLQPRQALTLPGMIDVILDADGITADMREAQREKMRVIEMFMQVGPDQWPGMIEEHGDMLDHDFFEMILATAENAAETGKEDMADALMQLYHYLIQNTPAGQDMLRMAETQEKTVRAVAEEIQALGNDMSRGDFMKLVLSYADDDERLQALVGLMRPALDYPFFQELTHRVDAATGDEREKLARLRQRLLDLSSVIDQQTQLVLQRAADTLRLIVNSQDLDAAIRPRLDQIDDTFLAVLQANIRAAQQNNDRVSAERLSQVLQKVLEILSESAPPQIKLINDLMSTDSDDKAHEIIDEHAPDYGAELPELMDVIADDLEANNQTQSAQRLRALRDYAAAHITPQA